MSTDRLTDFFDSYAEDFDAIYGTKKSVLQKAINRLFRKSMRLRFERVMTNVSISSDTSVLDIGCGPGHYSIQLARKGVRKALGIDVAPSMISLAKKNAELAGVSANCFFEEGDFYEYRFNEKFDYAIVMGVMDYIPVPADFISRVSSLTKEKAFFSFPKNSGFLAWQRKLRYQSRCDLFLYDEKKIARLFEEQNLKFRLERISRDYFVTLTMS